MTDTPLDLEELKRLGAEMALTTADTCECSRCRTIFALPALIAEVERLREEKAKLLQANMILRNYYSANGDTFPYTENTP